MKRNLALLLTLVMCIFCFTACGGGDASSEATSDVASGATSEAASDAGSEAASEGETVEFPGWDYITGKGKIVIGLDDTFAPMGFRDEAGTLVGFYWFLMMCGRLIGGAVGGKVSSKAMLTTVCTIALIFIACLMFIPETVRITIPVVEAHVPVSMVFMFLCGLCTSVMWGAIFNLAAEGLGKYTPVASGIFMTLVCGGGILPFIQGWVADKVGFIGSYWVIVAGLVYMLYYALIGSKNVNKDIEVE